MKLTVNGKTHVHSGGGTILALLEELRIDGRHVAVMVDDAVISRRDFSVAGLVEGCRVEIVTFVGGG